MLTAELLTETRQLFVVDDDVAYLNCAQMGPLLHSVRNAGERALQQRAAPWTLASSDWFRDGETLRPLVASLLNATAEDIAFIPAVSYGLASVARNLSTHPGDRVLVIDNEFPSNYYAWARFCERTGAELVVVTRERGQSWTDAVLAAVDERVVLASLPNVHWTNGALVDLDRVALALRDAGASLIIDASQSLGVMPLDVQRLQPLAVVVVGYKWLLGPYSFGYMYVAPELQGGEPLEEGWVVRSQADDFTRLVEYSDEYMPGARRFDVGERTNFLLTPLAIAAIGQLLEWTPERIGMTIRQRTDAIAAGVERLGLAVPPRDDRGPHMLGVGMPRETAERVSRALRAARVSVSVRGDSIRIAPHLHNNEADVDRLLTAIETAL